MSKNHPSVCVCLKPLQKQWFQAQPRKHICWSAEPKSGFFERKSRALPKHTETFRKFHVFPPLVRRVYETPIFIVFSGLHEAPSSKKCTFLKTFKNQGQRNKCSFRKICRIFWGARNPVFVVFSRPQKDRVQLSSFEATKIGFNYAHVSTYRRHICCHASSGTTFLHLSKLTGGTRSRIGKLKFFE